MTTTTNNDTTNTPEAATDNERRTGGCAARSCGPRGTGPRFGGPYAGPFAGPFGPHFAARFGGPGGSWRAAPVNIEDTQQAFVLSLFAAGLDKRGIRLSAQGDVLSIRYDAPAVEEGPRRFTRREQPHSSFAREFALNAKVQLDAIAASYSDGVLTVHLPKTPDALQPAREVPVQ
jgi:HSP20 family protein